MLTLIIVVLLIMWILGSFGHIATPVLAFESHGLVHSLLVIVLVLVVLRVLRIL